MTSHFINNIQLVEKNDYRDLNRLVTVGGYYLNDVLIHQNNNTLKGGGAIYSKLENYGVPAGLYRNNKYCEYKYSKTQRIS